MSKLKLFEYAVVLHKEKEGGKQGEYESAEIVISPTLVLAKDDKEVAFKATRQIKDEHAKNPDNIEILIRNF